MKKINKKGFAEETIETILKIIFFVGVWASPNY